MDKKCAYQHGIYVFLSTTNCTSQSESWVRLNEIPSSYSTQEVRKDIQRYCIEHNMIQCFITPKLARRERKKWETRNGRKAPELNLRTAYRG